MARTGRPASTVRWLSSELIPRSRHARWPPRPSIPRWPRRLPAGKWPRHGGTVRMPFGPRSFRTRATGPRARPAFLSHGAVADSIRVDATTTAVGARLARRPSGIRPAARPARCTGWENFPQPVTASPAPVLPRSTAMPHLTPTLPPRYRRRALAVLDGLMARAKGDVAGHRASVERLTAVGQETSTARAGLGLAERGLALLHGRQRFL